MNQEVKPAELSNKKSKFLAFNSPISFTSFHLKIIAILTMVTDHVGFLFFHDQLLWRIIGRISFAVFAFLIAEGFEKTSNVNKYFNRLISFAVISQIPYTLFRYAAEGKITTDLNIFFTLAAGLLVILCWKQLPLYGSIPLILGIATFAQAFSFDYGAYGVIVVLASQIMLFYRKLGWIALLLIHQLPVIVYSMFGIFSIQGFAALSIPIVASYNGERGMRLPRYAFYLFYPGNLLILWLLWILVS